MHSVLCILPVAAGPRAESGMTILAHFEKMHDAERSGLLRMRRAAHRGLRRIMIRRSWFGRLGLRLGLIAF